jgi:hypothetical protein
MSSTPLGPLKSREAVSPVLPDELVRNRGVVALVQFLLCTASEHLRSHRGYQWSSPCDWNRVSGP